MKLEFLHIAFKIKIFFISFCMQSSQPRDCIWLVAQLVKNLLAMWETCVRSLGWEYPLEKGKTTYSSFLAWKIPGTV